MIYRVLQTLFSCDESTAIKEAPHVLRQKRKRVKLIEQLESENALLLGHLQGNVKKSKEVLLERSRHNNTE